MRTTRGGVVAVFVIILVLTAGSCHSANDRPLIYGMNPTPMSWWGKDPNTWDPLLFQKMAAAGCASARIGVNWDQVEPTRDTRDWTEIDRWVKLCLDSNIEPVLLINSTPVWALPSDYDPSIPAYTARYPPGEDHAQDFHNWVFDLVRRFRGRARYYEFWNEANGYGWYTALQNPPTYSRADQYTPWMIRAYKALKLADPTSLMSTTGIDDGGDGHAAYFMNLIYQYGGKGYFDAVADHPYPTGGNFQAWKLDQIRSVLDSHGDTDIPVWITEFGYNWSSFQSQINYYFNTLTQDQYSYVRIATWHTANEFPWEAGFGLLDKNLNPKPEYNTFKDYAKPSRPVISNILAMPLSPSSMRVTCTTDIPAKVLVMYGRDDNYGFVTARESASSTSHTITIVGLAPQATYHYRIRAGAVEDGDSFSVDRTFATPNGTAVNITSGPTVVKVTPFTVSISWTTDAASTSAVDYSTDFGYDQSVSSSSLSTNHMVMLSGLQPSTNYQYRVTSTAPGYADRTQEGYPFTTDGWAGALVNAGFEDGTSGWTFWEVYPWRQGYGFNGHISVYSNGGAYPPSPAVMEGTRRITCDVGYASAVGGLYQTINVENGIYSVGGWVGAGCDGGTESVQLIAMDGPYTGGIPTGVNIADLSASAPWTYYKRDVDVTTGRLTVALRVSQWDAVNAVAGHFDGISVTRVMGESIGDTKTRPIDSEAHTVGFKVVSAVIDSHTAYIQDENRTSGIKVVTTEAHGLIVGRRVKLSGVLAVRDNEAQIRDATITATSAGNPPAPLAMGNAALGGGQSGVQPGVTDGSGANNIGLLIRTWGVVRAEDSSGFTIDDGSGTAVRCAIANADTLVEPGDYVAVTGISSCEAAGDRVQRLVRVRDANDIRVFRH